MTFKEACRKLNLSESTLKTNFRRTQERLLEKDIILSKEGYGNKAQYYIEEIIEGAVERYVAAAAYKIKQEIRSKQPQFKKPETDLWDTETVAKTFNIDTEDARNKLMATWIQDQ